MRQLLGVLPILILAGSCGEVRVVSDAGERPPDGASVGGDASAGDASSPTDAPPSCTPTTTCEEAGATCGMIADGCGVDLVCGDPCQFVEEDVITAPDPAAFDYFGYSAAIDGDTLLVGAAAEDNSDPDEVYLFERTASGTWAFVDKVGPAGDGASFSVALADGRAILGAAFNDDVAINGGAAHLWERGAGGQWEEVYRFVPDTLESNDAVGRAVAIDGDLAVVGASGDDDRADGGGAAYVLERDAAGQWNEIDKLLADDGAQGDGFGSSVAVDGDYIAVGTRANSVKVYLFRKTDTGIEPVTTLTASDNASAFNSSLAMDDGTLVVGAPEADDSAGALYLYQRVAESWVEITKLSADEETSNGLGGTIDVAGTVIVAGTNSAGAYVFQLHDGSWQQTQKHDETSYHTGVSTDGTRWAVGDVGFSGDAEAQGRAFIYRIE